MEKELLRGQEGKRITLFGFWINAILTSIKIFAGIIGKSGAMLADGIHSLSDFLSDVVVLIGFKIAEQPEDDSHNYGHEKYETLATALISLFLAIVGFEILKSGINNIINIIKGNTLNQPGIIALVAAIISIITKEFLFRSTKAVGNKINSPAIIANAWHHRSDAFSSIGTLLGIGGAIILGEKWTILDPIASVIVSIFIFKVAFEILMPAINELMETSLSEEEKEQISKVILNYEDVKSFHKLRTRKIGSKAVLEMHILVNEALNIKSAHNISSKIEADLKNIFGSTTIVTIHIEPDESNV